MNSFVLVLAVVAASSAPVAAIAPLPAGAAEIVNGGSTNTAPYRLVVLPSGDVTGTQGGEPVSAVIPAAVAGRLFDDLGAVRPLDGVGGHCMKSASFGSVTRIRWQNETTGDVSCGGALAADVRAVVLASGLSPLRGRRARLLVPVLPAAPSRPTATATATPQP